jgi:aryl-alcohol dehydrogenase-like predicted oxidoreductase
MTFGEQTDEAEAHRMLSFAAEAGVNLIDTAEVSGAGCALSACARNLQAVDCYAAAD